MIEPEVVATFPHVGLDDFRNLMFWLLYHRPPHGSGTGLTRADVLDMEMDEIMWWWKFLREAWDAEDTASRRQAKG